jgi:hypothetical protein
MKLGRTFAAAALAASLAAPAVAVATAPPASAALPICIPCILAGGKILSGNIVPNPNNFNYHFEAGPPGSPTLVHIYGSLPILVPIFGLLPFTLPILPTITLPSIFLPPL